MKTKTRLVVALSIILLTVFAVTSFINYAVTREAVRKELLESSLPLTGKNIYSEIHGTIMRPILVSSAMAHDSFLKDWVLEGEEDIDALTRYLKGIQAEYGFLTVFFVSNRTDRYYTSKGILKKVNPRDPHDVWYYAFTRYREPYALDVDTNQDEGDQMTIFVNYRLEDSEGRLLGVTGVGININHAVAMMKSVHSDFSRLTYLVDQDGLIQVHPDPSLVDRVYITEREGIRDVAASILSTGESSKSLDYNLNGRHYLLTTRYVSDFKWHLIVVQDEDSALEPARRNFIRTLVVGFLSTVLVIILCVTAVNHYQQRLEDMTRTDPLTGAANRRALEEAFYAAVNRVSRSGFPLSLIVIDLDDFKGVNDRLGHHAGDVLLKCVVKVMKESVRPSDMVARWGGDEFIILMDGTGRDAAALCTRILGKLKGHSVCPVSFSAGVAQFRPGDDLSDVTRRADAAMYRAKESGGCCEECIGEADEE